MYIRAHSVQFNSYPTTLQKTLLMTAMTHQSFKRTHIKLPCLCRRKKMNFVKNIFVWVCCQYSSIPIFSEQFINFQLVRKKSQNDTRARNVRRCIRGWDSCDASHSWPIRLFPVIQFPRSGPGPGKIPRPSVCSEHDILRAMSCC